MERGIRNQHRASLWEEGAVTEQLGDFLLRYLSIQMTMLWIQIIKPKENERDIY